MAKTVRQEVPQPCAKPHPAAHRHDD
jgi:hypothetical protein